MKTSTKLAVAFVALAGVAGAALTAQADNRGHSQDGGPAKVQQAYGGDHHGKRHKGSRHRGGGERHMFRMLESFDADGDGKLSQEEIDTARGERFTKFDADTDQALTLGEYEQLWLEAMRERMVDRFQHLDADGDGRVTTEEFQKPFAKTVTRMDRNEDGVIDREDFKRHRKGGSDSEDIG
jgi:Ca2+-binding EF-hand superfamily protein